MTVQNCFYRAC